MNTQAMNDQTARAIIIQHLDANRGERNPRSDQRVETNNRGKHMRAPQLRKIAAELGAEVECFSRRSTRYDGTFCAWCVTCSGWVPGMSGR